MDVLTELLPSSYTGKTEPSAKDSRRHPQDKKQADDEQPAKPHKLSKENTDKPEFVERRSGEDRRLKQVNRGRWLESRDRKDRRANPTNVFVKV
ncbi:MAG: hypothetical protein ACPG52_01025 [Cognaticolwellia sp.]